MDSHFANMRSLIKVNPQKTVVLADQPFCIFLCVHACLFSLKTPYLDCLVSGYDQAILQIMYIQWLKYQKTIKTWNLLPNEVAKAAILHNFKSFTMPVINSSEVIPYICVARQQEKGLLKYVRETRDH